MPITRNNISSAASTMTIGANGMNGAISGGSPPG